MLPRPTLRKILRETIATDGDNGTAGLQIPRQNQLLWLQDLADELSKMDRVEASVRDEFYIALLIRAAANSGRNLEWFMISFFPYPEMTVPTDRTGLWIADATYRRRRKAETESPVQNVEQIKRFIDAVKAKQDQTKLRDQRNIKLASLKQRGLQARLIELGEVHGFSFALGENKRDVNLSIRVCGKKSAYHIAFPKGKLDSVLERIPDLVSTLEELRTLGITFRTNNKPWAQNQGPWVDPQASSEA